jgi:hypothetical protein
MWLWDWFTGMLNYLGQFTQRANAAGFGFNR